MPILKLDESYIRQFAQERSFQRGEEYFENGAVNSMTQRGQTLSVEVEGSQYDPYHVSIEFDEGGILNALCSCPYDWGGWCKHIVAALLEYMEAPESVEDKAEVQELLASISSETSVSLLHALLSEKPELLEWIEDYLAFQVEEEVSSTLKKKSSNSSSKKTRNTSIDSKSIKKQVEHIFRDAVKNDYYHDYWDEGGIPDIEKIGKILDRVNGFLQNGDTHNAMLILEVVTEAWSEWEGEISEYYDDDGELWRELSEFWTKSILSGELNPEESQEWKLKLTEYEDQLEMPLLALKQGWSWTPLVETLKGNPPKNGLWGEKAVPDCANDLTLIRLQILEQRKQFQEYLHLAQAEGQDSLYLLMLIQLEKIEPLMAQVPQLVVTYEVALELAKTLRASRYLEESLQIAEHGLSLKLHTSSNYSHNEYSHNEHFQNELASWTADLAQGMGNQKLHFKARKIAFQSEPTFKDYKSLQELSDTEQWSKLKPQLLECLNSSSNASLWGSSDEAISIFLYESLWDQAIQRVDSKNSYYTQEIQKVMRAVLVHRPEWVMEKSKIYAEEIMDEGRAKDYDQAVQWLQWSKKAHTQMKQASEWRAYFNRLSKTHSRKYKLMGLFRGL